MFLAHHLLFNYFSEVHVDAPDQEGGHVIGDILHVDQSRHEDAPRHTDAGEDLPPRDVDIDPQTDIDVGGLEKSVNLHLDMKNPTGLPGNTDF